MFKFGSGRTVGLIMILGSMLVFCASPITFVYSFINPTFTTTAASMSVGFLTLLSATLLAPGIYFFRRGRKVINELNKIRHQKTLLQMLKHAGQVKFAEAATKMGHTVDYVQDIFCDLVGRKMIRGYFNPTEGVFSLHQPHWLLTKDTCPVCHSNLQTLEAGEYTCQTCEAKIFI